MNKVKFYSGTQEQYNNLSNKDSNAFYKTTDEKNLYLGESKLTHKEATTTTSGLLSASDKKKLDSIESGANKTIIDSALSSTSTNPVQNKVVKDALVTKATLEKWTCPVEVGTWSRVCNIGKYSVGILTVTFLQNSQTLVYKYCIGTGYNSAFISQVASSGFEANSDIGVRITRDRSVTSYFVEIINNFGYDSATSVSAFLSYEQLDNSGGTFIKYTEFNATDLNSTVITSIVSKPDGIVSPKFYGNLIGIADTATKATQDEVGNNIKSSYASSISISDHTITLKNKNGASLGTVTVPDNNTTYGVATSSSLGLVKSGTDITVDSSGNVSVNDDSHNHVISNVDGLQSALDGKAASSHTHNYAGSSSAGGSANSAVKLDSSAGSSTQPIYFSGGKPVACSGTYITSGNYSSYIPTIYSGTGSPSSSTGKNGDVYFKYS